jgi:hypothetical protein
MHGFLTIYVMVLTCDYVMVLTCYYVMVLTCDYVSAKHPFHQPCYSKRARSSLNVYF